MGNTIEEVKMRKKLSEIKTEIESLIKKVESPLNRDRAMFLKRANHVKNNFFMYISGSTSRKGIYTEKEVISGGIIGFTLTKDRVANLKKEAENLLKNLPS